MMAIIVDGDDDDINCGDMIDDADSDADLWCLLMMMLMIDNDDNRWWFL